MPMLVATIDGFRGETQQIAFAQSQTIEEYTRAYFVDIPVMSNIAYCESRFRQFDKNGDILRGNMNISDVGVMQINEYYHLKGSIKSGYDIHTLAGNVGYARDLYERKGTAPWISSKPCWDNKELAIR